MSTSTPKSIPRCISCGQEMLLTAASSKLMNKWYCNGGGFSTSTYHDLLEISEDFTELYADSQWQRYSEVVHRHVILGHLPRHEVDLWLGYNQAVQAKGGPPLELATTVQTTTTIQATVDVETDSEWNV